MPTYEFRLPDVGEGITEGEIVSWLISPGETVAEDQPIAEMETDKALVEIPSPVEGTVDEITVEEGDVVPVGTVIITFETVEAAAEEGPTDEPPADPGRRDDSTESRGKPEQEPTGEPERAVPNDARATPGRTEPPVGRSPRIVAPPSVRRLARELGVDLSAIDGSGAGGRVTEADVRRAGETPTRATETPAERGRQRIAESASRTDVPGPDSPRRDRTLAMPATRWLARERGVDIDDVPADREFDGQPFVTENAVREFAASRQERSPIGGPESAAPEPIEPPISPGKVPEGKAVERVPYRGVRRTVGRQMQRSLFTAPHVTHHDEVEVTDLVELRAEYEPLAGGRGVHLTYLPFVVKAVVAALKRYPRFNASLDEENDELVIKRYYNIGVAVATDVGLLVPVVEDADRKSMFELAAEVETLAGKARERSIGPEELRGGTFTITNYGSIGGEFATPIINHPEVAILGLGRVKDRPWVVDRSVEARKTLRLSLAFDHRVVDGADAAEFTNAVTAYLNDPRRLIVE